MPNHRFRPITSVSLLVLLIAAATLALGPQPSVPAPSPLKSVSSEADNISALLEWIGAKSMIEVRDSKVDVVNALELYRELVLVPRGDNTALSALILATYARGFPGQSLSFLLESGGLDPNHVGNSVVSAAILGLAATEPIDAIRFSNDGLLHLELRHSSVDRAEAAVRMNPDMMYLRAVASACNVSLYRQCRERLDMSGQSALLVSLDHAMAGLKYLAEHEHLLVASHDLPELPSGKISDWSAYVLAPTGHSKVAQMSCLLLLGNYLETVSWLSLDSRIDSRAHESCVDWAIQLIESIRSVSELGPELALQLDLDIAGASNILSRSCPPESSWVHRAAAAFAKAAQVISQTSDCRSRIEFIGQTPLYAGLDLGQLHCK